MGFIIEKEIDTRAGLVVFLPAGQEVEILNNNNDLKSNGREEKTVMECEVS